MGLALETPNSELWAVEIKRLSAATVSKGFYDGCEDMRATHKYVVYPGRDNYSIGEDTEVIGLIQFLNLVRKVDQK